MPFVLSNLLIQTQPHIKALRAQMDFGVTSSHPHYVSVSVNWHDIPRKYIQSFSEFKIHTFWPKSPQLEIHSLELDHQKDPQGKCTWVFIATAFVIAKTGNT